MVGIIKGWLAQPLPTSIGRILHIDGIREGYCCGICWLGMKSDDE